VTEPKLDLLWISSVFEPQCSIIDLKIRIAMGKNLKISLFIPFFARNFIGKYIRSIQRHNYSILQESSNATAVRFQKSLRINGYENSADNNNELDFLYMVKDSDLNLWIENLAHTTSVLKGSNVNYFAILDQEPSLDNANRIKEVCPNLVVKFESDYKNELSELNLEIKKFSSNRQTWIRQQVLKSLFVGSNSKPTVILDSDTYIMKNLCFENNSVQMLLCGSDFHSPYSRHLKKFLGIVPTATSFVHHCQLQYPEFVREIYGQDLISGLKRWLRLGIKFAEYSAVSEFQTYGDYVLSKYPDRVKLFFHKHHEVSRKEVKGSVREYLLHHGKECDCDLLTFINK
jgi:hypothetical protein